MPITAGLFLILTIFFYSAPVFSQEKNKQANSSESLGEIAFSYGEDSWTEVYDRTGKKLFFDIGRAGKITKITGAPPFLVFLGNARLVKIKYNDKEHDVSSYLRGKSARFKIGITKKDGHFRENANIFLAKGAVKGDLNLIKKSISYGANVNKRWATNLPLYWASGEGQLEAVIYLLKSGADINGLSGIANRSALHEAALRGHFDVVKLLIKKGANINIRNTHKRTPLYYVTNPPMPLSKPKNASQIKEYLISKGATQ